MRRLLLEWKARRPYVARWEGGPLLVLPGVLDPVATKVGEWLARIVEPRPGEHWADMGCGTGIVGLALAARGARVTAIDVDPTCVRNARANAALHRRDVTVIESDLFEFAPGPFDAVVYNVPFWPGEPKGTFGRAFYAGRDFAAIRRFVEDAPRHAPRTLVALSEAGADHQGAKAALGPSRLLLRERWRSEWLALYEVGGPPHRSPSAS